MPPVPCLRLDSDPAESKEPGEHRSEDVRLDEAHHGPVKSEGERQASSHVHEERQRGHPGPGTLFTTAVIARSRRSSDSGMAQVGWLLVNTPTRSSDCPTGSLSWADSRRLDAWMLARAATSRGRGPRRTTARSECTGQGSDSGECHRPDHLEEIEERADEAAEPHSFDSNVRSLGLLECGPLRPTVLPRAGPKTSFPPRRTYCCSQLHPPPVPTAERDCPGQGGLQLTCHCPPRTMAPWVQTTFLLRSRGVIGDSGIRAGV